MTQTTIFDSGAKEAPKREALQEVAQHNNLIFAPFALASMESRIFITMLSYIDRKQLMEEGESFPEWRIPILDILPHKNGYYFEDFKKAARNIVAYVVDIAPIDGKKRKTMPRTIVRKCDHEEGKSYAICQFHEDMKEYLIKLIGNFTKADLGVLKEFKDEKSVRFYWMLKSRFYNSNKIIITVEECRTCLLEKGSTAYAYPSELKKHILEKTIKEELSDTDCAFEIAKTVKNGNTTVGWEFVRKEGSITLLPAASVKLSSQLISLLSACEMDKKGMQKINGFLGKQINGQIVDEKFISYVARLRKEEKDKKGSKIVNLAGYIVDTIREGWLTEQYMDALQGKVVKGQVYKQPVGVKRAAEDSAQPQLMKREEAEKAYEQLLASGSKRYPTLNAYIHSLKMQNIYVQEQKAGA